jgi:hypothetical protein
MIRLSNRQLKEADRQVGLMLVLDWPEGLARPAMRPDTERAPTPAQHAAATRIIGATAAAHGLTHIATRVAMLERPALRPRPGAIEPHLLAHVVSARWLSVALPADRRAYRAWPADEHSAAAKTKSPDA